MVSTKTCVLILAIIVLLLSGISYATVVYNSTPKNDSNQQSPTIIVNGDGSSGTGDVTNTQIVTVTETKVDGYDNGVQAEPKVTVIPPEKTNTYE